MKHPNPFYLGKLKKTLTDRETEEMYNTMKWVAFILTAFIIKCQMSLNSYVLLL